MLTPWFLNLFVLPGGGTLWTDLASGDRGSNSLPGRRTRIHRRLRSGEYAAGLPVLPAVRTGQPRFATQEAAVAAAEAALTALFIAPAVEAAAAPSPEALLCIATR